MKRFDCPRCGRNMPTVSDKPTPTPSGLVFSLRTHRNPDGEWCMFSSVAAS